MPDDKKKKAGATHHVWNPPGATWLQAGWREYYAAGSVIPSSVAADPELSDSNRQHIEERKGAKPAAEPSERPWAQ